jgi:hypothetical protein
MWVGGQRQAQPIYPQERDPVPIGWVSPRVGLDGSFSTKEGNKFKVIEQPQH